jgi:hypothetical protein
LSLERIVFGAYIMLVTEEVNLIVGEGTTTEYVQRFTKFRRNMFVSSNTKIRGLLPRPNRKECETPLASSFPAGMKTWLKATLKL